MARKYAILPCNGLDKLQGPLSREVALALVEETGGEIVCPVLLNSARPRYEKILGELPLIIIDGCGTKCASKLAGSLNLKVDRKVLIADEMKTSALTPEDSLSLGPAGLEFAKALATLLAEDMPEEPSADLSADFDSPVEYTSVTHDKFIFRIPAAGFHFNENDCWVRVKGTRARIGVSDYVQQNLTDISYFGPPIVGREIGQFDDAGTVESVKSTMDVISPVSGKIVAVNTALVDNPEIINEDPYEKGWIAELELTDFESDRELLIDGAAYGEIVKKKAAEAQH